MDFKDILLECCLNEELVGQFNRLEKTNLSFKDKRKPIEIMVDEATGYNNPYRIKHDDMAKFISFVFEFIWMPLCLKGEK